MIYYKDKLLTKYHIKRAYGSMNHFYIILSFYIYIILYHRKGNCYFLLSKGPLLDDYLTSIFLSLLETFKTLNSYYLK